MSGIDTVSTCSVRITWPAAIAKSMHIGRRSLNRLLLLQRRREAHESKYHVPDALSIDGMDLATIIAFATGPGVNGSESELLSWAMAWWALFGRLAGVAVLLLLL